MLHVQNLVVDYGHISALRDISFYVNTGEVVAVIGSNGAGKSTTLMSISGLVKKKAGRVLFLDEDITDTLPSKIVKKGISHIPEGRHIFPEMSVEENLFMGTFGAKETIPRHEFNTKLEEVFAFFPRLKERRRQIGGYTIGRGTADACDCKRFDGET